jgi:Ras-related protein Rab-18|tara:strand:+ start:1338 stop:1925 length:588 start_codon:yes stop_codon:yes gene_type:complete
MGGPCVGKTALTERLISNKFPHKYNATIGVDFSAKNLVIDNMNIKTHIWDTAGQKCFSSIITSYFTCVAGAAIMFDVGKKSSFHQVDYWREEIEKRGTINHVPVMILIANKVDKKHREVSKEEAEKYAKKHNMLYCETSAKDNLNVHEFYEMLIERIYQTADLDNPRENKGVRKSMVCKLKIKPERNTCCGCIIN